MSSKPDQETIRQGDGTGWQPVSREGGGVSFKSDDLGLAFHPPYYRGLKLFPDGSPLGWVWRFKDLTFWCYRKPSSTPRKNRLLRIDRSDKAKTTYPSKRQFTEVLMSVFDKHLDELKAMRIPEAEWQAMLEQVIVRGEGVAA